jgi:hypothetical protein
MATKNKKHKQQVRRLAFNQKNTLALADQIFSDRGGVVSLLKLCHGTLANGKDGGRTTHCAVGEAYFHFVNHNLGNVNRAEDPTASAIDALVQVSVLKKDTPANRKKLGTALDSAVGANDDTDEGDDLASFVERSRLVADVFRKKVAPLLK